MLSENARDRLHAIVAATVRAAASSLDPAIEEPVDEPELTRLAGAFVTLRKRGRLRGCIGTIPARTPLWETVREMAVSASVSDPRFDPVEPEEVEALEIEISVLSPLRLVEDPSEVEVGRDGLYLKRGHASGLLLPQVATEQRWDREQFLENTCRKAGLPGDAWKDPETTIHVFEAEVF